MVNNGIFLEASNIDMVLKKIDTYEDTLFKKTNEELKQILKEQGKHIKGTKAELVKRIMEEN